MKILLVKTSALGDVIHCYPVISYIKAIYPHAIIDWVVEAQCTALVDSHPDIRHAFIIQTKKWRKAPLSLESLTEINASVKEIRKEKYDVVFDLQGNVKSGVITAFARAKAKVGFAKESVAEKINLLFTKITYNPPEGQNIRQDYLSIIQQFFANKPRNQLEHTKLDIQDSERLILEEIMLSIPQNLRSILVCPGSAWPNKTLPTTKLIAFLESLNRCCESFFLIAWGSYKEQEEASAIQRAFPNYSFVLEKLSLPLLQNLMAEVDAVVAMDSLPLHLAGTTSTATYSFFGPSSSEKYRPIGEHHYSIQGVCPYNISFDKRCPRLRTCKTGACINDLDFS